MDVFLFKVTLMTVKGTRSPPEERIGLNPQKAGNGHFCCRAFPANTWQKNSVSKIVQVNITVLRPSTLLDHCGVIFCLFVLILKEMHVH